MRRRNATGVETEPSLLLRTGLRHHLRPFFVFAADEPAKFLRRSRHRLPPDDQDLVSHRRVLERGDDRPVEAADDVARRAGGRHETEPSDRLEARQPGFLEGGELWGAPNTAAAQHSD